MLGELFDRRVLIVLGKGGVGKTVLSAAIARLAALSGKRALILETDSRAPLATTLGVEASFDPVEIEPNLSLMTLDGRHALEEYLRLVVPGRMLLKAVFASRVYQFFVQAAPGLRELMMLGKVYYETERAPSDSKRHDLIIVDAPASGQALSLLKMPTAAHSTFGDSMVGKESKNISALLHDPRRCTLVQVSTSDSLSVSETIETHAELASLDLKPSIVLFNRAIPLSFDNDDIATLLGRRRGGKQKRSHLAELAESELVSAEDSRKAASRIRRATHASLVEVAEHGGIDGLDLIARLTADLAEVESAGEHDHRRAAPPGIL
jgi:anion-transporting  ArsA/GET3 family ATPase